MLPLQNSEWIKKSFNNFIVPKYRTSSLSTIQNRAQILDTENTLKCLMGMEFIEATGIIKLEKEAGILGDYVFELANKDSRVRFIGSYWEGTVDSVFGGVGVRSARIGNILEVEFYGTGLILYTAFDGNPIDIRCKIDNGAEGSNLIPTNNSNVLQRDTNPNQPIVLASGLSLGWHKVEVTQYTTNYFRILRLGIVNDRQNILVNAGTGFVGNSFQSLSAPVTTAYNAGVIGTKGARVVKYLLDNAVSQSVAECASSPSYLTNANHVNEEIIKTMYWREAGYNRGDDFSALTGNGAGRTWVARDSHHALISDSAVEYISSTPKGLRIGSDTKFLNYHFVGTGLDIVKHGITSVIDPIDVWVDGVLVGSLNSTNANNKYVIEKIASGLPYGEHIIKFLFNGADTGDFGFIEFITYQPKKPIIPDNAFELDDYCVVANFVLNSIATIGLTGPSSTSQGTIRKYSRNGISYFGTWAFSNDTGQIGGCQVYSNTTSDYYEFEFFGIGFIFRGQTSAGGSTNSTVMIDGSTNHTGLTVTGFGNFSMVQATGVMEIQDASEYRGAGLLITGLSLGWHKVRITKNDTAFFYADAFDVITPIHKVDKKFKSGSTVLGTSQVFESVKKETSVLKSGEAKAFVCFDGATGNVLKSLNVSGVLRIGAGTWFVFFEKPFKDQNYICAGAGGAGNVTLSPSANEELGKTKSGVKLLAYNTGGSLVDDGKMTMAFYGDLEDET